MASSSDQHYKEINLYHKCLSHFPELERLKNYQPLWYRQHCVINTTIPQLLMGDMDGIPLSFMLSNYNSNSIDLVFTPWLVGQVSQTLEQLDMSHKEAVGIPYSYSGDLSDARSRLRLEMMMFKPKHIDIMQSKIHVGAITGRACYKPLSMIDYNGIYPILCIPDYKKKEMHIRYFPATKPDDDNLNIQHFAKYTIDPINNEIRWIFSRDVSCCSGNVRGIDAFNYNCWETKSHIDRYKARKHEKSLSDHCKARDENIIKRCFREEMYTYPLFDFALKKIQPHEYQVIKTLLPKESASGYIRPLMFMITKQHKMGSSLILPIPKDGETILYDQFGLPKTDEILPHVDKPEPGSSSPFQIFGITNMIRLNNEKLMMGIVASLNENGNEVDYICIPDYGKGILYYMHDKKINTKYHYLLKFVIDYLYAKTAWWVIPNLNDYYENNIDGSVGEWKRFLEDTNMVKNRNRYHEI